MSPDEDAQEAVIDALELLLPVNSFSVDLVALRKGEMMHCGDRYTEAVPELAELVPLLVSDHPGVKWTLKHGPPKVQVLRDFVSERQMRELQIYNLLMKAHEFRDQAVALVPVPNGTLAFVLNRDRMFTVEEFQLLEMAQPHIGQVLGRRAKYVVPPGDSRLSPREREVLEWMMRGKADGEIAIILGISKRTVQDHSGHILHLLGAENRTTAVALVMSGGLHK